MFFYKKQLAHRVHFEIAGVEAYPVSATEVLTIYSA
jgi:hypothetical protein